MKPEEMARLVESTCHRTDSVGKAWGMGQQRIIRSCKQVAEHSQRIRFDGGLRSPRHSTFITKFMAWNEL